MPCIFCEIVAERLPASVVYEDEQVMAFMDIHPMAAGHTLIIPRKHARSSLELDASLQNHLWQVGHKIAAAIRQTDIPCDGHHFLINDGKAANQTVPHVHLHVIPRKRGDGIRIPARMVGHVIGLLSPLPISGRKRQRLDQQAKAIRSALNK